MQSITKTWLLYTWNDNKMPMGHIAHLRKIFIFSISFYKLATNSPCRRAWLFILNRNLNFLYPRMLYAKFGWNWPCSSGEICFLSILHTSLSFLLLSPLEEGCGPLFVKIWIPSTQGCYVSNLVVIGQVVLKRGFLNIFNIILLCRIKLPFEKCVALHINKLESPPLKDVLCQVWLKLTKLFWIRRF